MKNKITWIIGMIVTVLLINIIIINFYLENREAEYFEESCWYMMDKYPDICIEIEAKAKEDIKLTIEEIGACPCKDRSGIPLNMGPRGEFYEIDKNYVGEGCIYHKECKKQEIEGFYYYSREYDKEDIKNVDVDLGGSSVIRVGNETHLILRIRNTNKRTDLIIKNIKISNTNNEVIKESIINQEIKPIRKEINKLNNFITLPVPFVKGPIYMWWAQKIIPKWEEGSFRESYGLDIRNFSSSPPKIGETIKIFVEVEFSYDSKSFIIKRDHSVLISEPLPIPPRD